VAKEIAGQLVGQWPILVRLCGYSYDHDLPNGKCLYCGKERMRLKDYLCQSCLVEDDPYSGKVSEGYELPKDWSGVFPAKEFNP
jgi:hypothetical protein